MDIFEAAEHGNYMRVASLVRQQSINIVNQQGLTALHIASIHGHSEIVGLLLLNKAVISLKDPAGQTALHHAIAHNHLNVAIKLVEHGANVNELDDKGMSALHIALSLPEKAPIGAEIKLLEQIKYSIISLLIKHGAYIDYQIHVKYANVHLLMKNGVDLTYPLITNRSIPGCLLDEHSHTRFDGYSPLHYLLSQNASKHYKALARILISYGAKIDTQGTDETGIHSLLTGTSQFPLWYLINYPLHEAVIADDEECVARLLIHGHKPQESDNFGRNAFILAVRGSATDRMLHIHASEQ